MKLKFSLLFIFLLSIFTVNITEASATLLNPSGMKGDVETVQDLPNYSTKDLVKLGEHKNVPLTKQWKVNFNQKASLKNLVGVVVVYEDELIPVTISGLNSKQLTVQATYAFPANAKLQLRIYLANGKWYTIDFQTEDAIRDVTAYENSSFGEFVPIYLNGKIKGQFHGSRDNYTFRVHEMGKLTIPQTEELELIGHQVYKVLPDGSQENVPPLVYTSLQYEVYLTPGQYVLFVGNSTGEDDFTYPLELQYTADQAAVDSGTDSFEEAPFISLNETFSSTLNFLQADGSKDLEDYYRFEVAKDGFVKWNFEIPHFNSFDLELYNAQLEKLEANRAQDESSYFWQLPQGSYYLKLSNTENPTTYTLSYSAFYPAAISADVLTQLQQLKQQWALLKPTYKGSLMTENTQYTVPYKPGNVLKEPLVDALNYTQMMRYTAGLPMNLEVQDYLNEYAQASSFINMLNGSLSHSPVRPDNVSDELYEMGYKGSGMSNIATSPFNLYDTVQMYMDDLGHNNSLNVGHRLWILNPNLSRIGFGFATKTEQLEGFSYDINYSAMALREASNQKAFFDTITWPAKTVMPLEFAEDKASWSISFNSDKYALELENIQVRMTKNGETEILNAANTTYFNISDAHSNTFTTLVFKPNTPPTLQEGDHFIIEVTGLKDKLGNPITYEYETTFLSIE